MINKIWNSIVYIYMYMDGYEHIYLYVYPEVNFGIVLMELVIFMKTVPSTFKLV